MEDDKKKLLKSPIKGLNKNKNFLSAKKKSNTLSKKILSDLLLQGRNQEAYNIVKQNKDIQTQDSRLYFLLGIICKINKDYILAEIYLKNAITIEPDEERFFYELAGIYIDCKEYDKALKLLNDNKLIDKEDAEIYNIKALAHMGKEETSKAKEYFVKALRSRTKILNLHFNYAIFLNKINKHRIAIKHYKKALLEDKKNLDIIFNLSVSYIAITNLDDAKEGFESILLIEPSHIGALINLGIILNRKRETDKSIESFRKVISIDNYNHSALTNLANIYHNLGMFKDSIKYANKILDLNSKDIDAQNILAGSFYELNEYDKSIAFSKNTLKIDRFNIHAMMNLVNNYFVNEDYEALNKYSNNLREIDPCNPLLASLDPLIAYITNKKNTSSFIDNPIDYIQEFNLKDYTKDSRDLISSIIDISRSITNEYNPRGKTTIGGLQTLPVIFDDKSEEITILEKIIRKCIDDYIEKYIESNLLYIKKWPKTYILQGWTVFLEKLGMQKSHNHLSGWMSGVIYLKMPKTNISKDEGSIEFSLHGYDYPGGNLSVPKKVLQPDNGSIFLFPSSLYHKTIPFNSNEQRISLAFDVINSFGGKRIGLGK